MRRAVVGSLLGAALLALAAVAAGTAEREIGPGPAAAGSGPRTSAALPPAPAVGRLVDLAPLIDSGRSECIRLNRAQESTIAALVAARSGAAAGE